jgi:FAD-dependent oxidoreductase domain-containing protein 1
MADRSFDVLIVGGGVMGCSIAYHLMKEEPKLKVLVIERDPSYQYASTTLSMGGVRIQFSLKENVLISLHAQETLRHFEEEMAVEGEKPDIGFHREGYLFLIDREGEKGARSSLALQKEMGAEVEWWSPDKMKKEFPLLDVSPWVGGTYGPQDGYLDGYAFLMAYRAKARSLGTMFENGTVSSLEKHGSKITGVVLTSNERYEAPVVVNAAGAWSAEIANTAGVKLPVEPVKRQVFAFKSSVALEKPLPLIIPPSGLYFRTETGGLFLVGHSFDDDPVGFDFTWDRKRFQDVLWPELAEIVPAFDSLKLVRGWAGLYDVNRLDGNAILGQWPEVKGLYIVCGFSGHGLQQAPAVGRYLSELILEKKTSLDLGIFCPTRILEGRPLSEAGLV